MKKIVFIIVSALFFCAPMAQAESFVYDEWSGFFPPNGKVGGKTVVRLKVYCKNGHWTRNAVSHPDANKPALSENAKNYLRSLAIPASICTSDQAIGSALWFVESDQVVTDAARFGGLDERVL